MVLELLGAVLIRVLPDGDEGQLDGLDFTLLGVELGNGRLDDLHHPLDMQLHVDALVWLIGVLGLLGADELGAVLEVEPLGDGLDVLVGDEITDFWRTEVRLPPVYSRTMWPLAVVLSAYYFTRPPLCADAMSMVIPTFLLG